MNDEEIVRLYYERSEDGIAQSEQKYGRLCRSVIRRILPDERLEIAVKDHGVGIADVAQARTPMYTTGGEERSGMGFTIMESFMTELRVTSTPGKGTTVHMKRKIVRRGEKA